MQTASQMMTLRTRTAFTILDTSANYGVNTDSATTIGGGFWGSGTSTAPYLKKGLLTAARRIILQTNGRARMKDLRLILNPIDAVTISASAEIHDYVKSSVYSQPMITGDLNDNPNEAYGIPPRLHGIEVIVEDTPYVSDRPYADGTAGTRAYIKAANSAVIVYRPGGMDGAYGSKAFSSLQTFFYKYEMAVETKSEAWDRLINGSVVEWYVHKLVAPMTAFYVSAIIS